MSKVVGMLISLQDNIAAASAVTAIRPPFGNEFFAPETDTSPSALSGLRKNFDTIDKHDVGHCHREPPVSSRRLRHLERKRGTSQRRGDGSRSRALRTVALPSRFNHGFLG